MIYLKNGRKNKTLELLPCRNIILNLRQNKDVFKQKQFEIIYCHNICTITNSEGSSSGRRKIESDDLHKGMKSDRKDKYVVKGYFSFLKYFLK